MRKPLPTTSTPTKRASEFPPLAAVASGIGPGRPRKPIPADAAERIEELAADGWSIVGIAYKLGTSKDTLAKWIAEDEELRAAFDFGRERERKILHNVVFREAVEGEGKNKLLAAMFLLNSRHNYRSDHAVDNESRVNVTINLPAARPMSDFIEVSDADGNQSITVSTARA